MLGIKSPLNIPSFCFTSRNRSSRQMYDICKVMLVHIFGNLLKKELWLDSLTTLVVGSSKEFYPSILFMVRLNLSTSIKRIDRTYKRVGGGGGRQIEKENNTKKQHQQLLCFDLRESKSIKKESERLRAAKPTFFCTFCQDSGDLLEKTGWIFFPLCLHVKSVLPVRTIFQRGKFLIDFDEKKTNYE